jgi:hypothetical protein
MNTQASHSQGAFNSWLESQAGLDLIHGGLCSSIAMITE